MVTTKLIHTVLKSLERYLVEKNHFRLWGNTYDLILLIPSDRYLSDTKYSLLLSAKVLNTLDQKSVIIELLNEFKSILSEEEYNALSRLNIIHSEDPLVKNLKMVFGFRQQIIEINEIPVGGVKIDYALLVKSLVLDKLIEGNALQAVIKDEMGKVADINMGVIRMEEDFNIFFYTGKGLREMFKLDMTEEETLKAADLKKEDESYLIQHQYIGKQPLDRILQIK